jgi:hypothetical protein
VNANQARTSEFVICCTVSGVTAWNNRPAAAASTNGSTG